jgi:hypothetical protein
MEMERERERKREREKNKKGNEECALTGSAIVLRLETECILLEYEMARCSHLFYEM